MHTDIEALDYLAKNTRRVTSDRLEDSAYSRQERKFSLP